MIIVGNLKMNFSHQEMIQYMAKLDNSKLIICPSFIYLNLFNQNGYAICAQNVSEFANGPYTGEISASQIKSLNVPYVLIGHSERRHVFNESQTIINNKISQALKQDLSIIYCIGETATEKKEGLTKQILLEQIISIFDQLTSDQINKIIIGYEPVWAISDGINPGITPSNEEIEATILYIKKTIKEKYLIDLNVLYGGSVNLNNLNELLKLSSNDGFLIGGASKNIDDLLKIAEISNE